MCKLTNIIPSESMTELAAMTSAVWQERQLYRTAATAHGSMLSTMTLIGTSS